MGDAADLIFEAAEGEYFSYVQEKQKLFSLPDEKLIRLTSHARSEKIKSIRSSALPLSKKQKWCLVFWLLEHGHE